ncbi:MAG: NADH-quinone oxidoreductase subunit NuoK [Ignavibacteriaceae bacterium]|nr:NADH-quinone oxidoreductase subunit NuoK [Ignavibacteriaceae bacterium]NUM69630.1 NADH-quinone oxidoreductase subunit NuoK [Ignavibacteriaceae bacterium]
MSITLTHFIAVSAVLFSLGLFAILTRRNSVTILMGLELILNAANLNFVAFARFSDTPFRGDVAVLIVIVIAAAETAVALAIFINIFRNFGSIDPNEIKTLKE